MAKLLSIQDKILIGLAIIGDVFDDVRTVGGYRGWAYQIAYGFTPEKYKKENFLSRVSKMLSSDLIEKVIEKGEVKFRVSSTGKNKLTRNFPLLAIQNKPWDKKWRVLTFDIPQIEKYKRDSLRRKLKAFGFGMVQQSVWISPHSFEDDINDFVKENNLENYVCLFVSNKMLIGEGADFVEKVWHVNDLNKFYEEVYNTNDLENYMELISFDPYLPKEFLPKPWFGDTAREKFKKLALQKSDTAVL